MNELLKLLVILIRKPIRLLSLLFTRGPVYTYKKLFKPRLDVYSGFLTMLFHNGPVYTWNMFKMSVLYGTTNPVMIKWQQEHVSYPEYIEVEVSTRCNLRCIMCEHTYWKEPGRDMTFEQYADILKQFPRLKWIGLTGIGESFMNRDFLKMCRFTKEKGIFIEIFDNLFMVDENVSKELVDMKLDRVIISMDGATKETYEKMRPGSDFDRVVRNIKALIKNRADAGAVFPKIDVHYIVSRHNMHEMVKFVEFIHSLGSGLIKELRFTRVLHKYPEIEGMYAEIPQEAIAEVEKKAEELGVNMVWGSDVPLHKPAAKNCVAWTMPFIFVTGEVIPCCAANEANKRQFQKDSSMGNVFEKPFKEIWEGEKYSEFRKKLFSGGIPAQCASCPVFDVSCKRD